MKQLTSNSSHDPLERVRWLLQTQFIRGSGLTDLQAVIIQAAMHEIETLRNKVPAPQAPIARIRIGLASDYPPLVVKIYSPGLPSGEHDLYCEPMSVAPAHETSSDLAYVTQQRDIAWGAIQTIKSGPQAWIGVAADDILAWAQSEADKGLAPTIQKAAASDTPESLATAYVTGFADAAKRDAQKDSEQQPENRR